MLVIILGAVFSCFINVEMNVALMVVSQNGQRRGQNGEVARPDTDIK